MKQQKASLSFDPNAQILARGVQNDRNPIVEVEQVENNLVVENHDQKYHKSGDLFLFQTAR